MPQLARVPPGRAGRMWLRGRLATAQRGREQLDRKLRILMPELQRRQLQAAQWHRDWQRSCQQADTWLYRAGILGGQAAIINASPIGFTEIVVSWASAMGVRYPADVRITQAATPSTLAPSNSAVVQATAAYQQALLAGIRVAAADEAVRRVEAEIAITRRRMRALDKRWLPWLQDQLAALELALEQSEQEDGVRIRRAVAVQPDLPSPR